MADAQRAFNPPTRHHAPFPPPHRRVALSPPSPCRPLAVSQSLLTVSKLCTIHSCKGVYETFTHKNFSKDQSMTRHLPKLLLILTLAIVTPLAAHETYSIRRALVSRNYGLALALTKKEFAGVRSGGEAANLIRTIIVSAPANQIAPLVTTAVETSPQFGQDIIRAAVEGAPPSERAAILTSAYYVLSHNSNTSSDLLEYIDALRQGNVPIYNQGTTPWFNPGASVGHAGSR
jgi:hypothetical protein